MNDSKWERYAAMGGVGFVVLNIIAVIVGGSPPAPDDPPAKIAEYFADHGGGIKAGLWLGGLASIGLIWWLGSLWRRMNRAEGGNPRLAVVSVVGLAIGGALFLASTSVGAATSLRATDIAEGATVFYTLSVVLLSAAGFGMGIHLLATSVLGLRSTMMPAWLVWLGIVAGVAFVVAGVIGATTDGSGAMVIGLIGFVGWSVWILGISWVMWREAPAAAIAP